MKAKPKERCRDLVGQAVVFTRDIETKARTYPKGYVGRIYQTHHGRFQIAGGPLQVPRSAFDVLDHLPECGFIEGEGGSIAWGSRWEPSTYGTPEPVCIEYQQAECGAWVPFQVWTKDEHGGIDMHDADWIELSDTLYHHESGGGQPYTHGYSDPEALPGRMWLADGASVSHASERPKRPLSDAELLAMGIKRVRGPTPDPFAGAIEGDTFYDERSGERVPDDDGEICRACAEQFVRQDGDLVVLDEYTVDTDECPGLYRGTSRWDTGEWVAPLPLNRSYESDAICPGCAAETIADFGLRGLLDAWCEDAEAMSDEHREALLDAVRERVATWVDGFPKYRAAHVHDVFALDLAPRLELTNGDIHRLLEDAGYG